MYRFFKLLNLGVAVWLILDLEADFELAVLFSQTYKVSHLLWMTQHDQWSGGHLGHLAAA